MLCEKLDYVLAIAEERNLTRAAKKLYISQPALTLYLNRLEADLGVKLFDRSKYPLTITEAGVYYIEKMKPIYYAEQVLRNDIQMVAVPTRTLTIAIGQVRGHDWLYRILPKFCARYPKINLEISQTAELNMVQQLKTGEIDVAIGVLPVLTDEIETADLMQEKLFFAAHKQFDLVSKADRDRYTPEHPILLEAAALNGLPFIRPRVSNGLYSSYEKILSDNKIIPGRTISMSNLSTGFRLAMEGLGIQLLSGPILRAHEHDPGLQNMDFFVLEHMPATRKCIAAFNRSNIKQDLIDVLVEIIRSEMV